MVFLKRVIKNYKNVGSIIPSSRHLYKKMTCCIDFKNDLTIVEFWPGDWIFTDKILKSLSANSKLYIFELDTSFYNFLKEKYKQDHRVILYNESACKINEYIENNSVDCIISSLPLSFIDKNKVDDILKKSNHILKDEWEFIQYQYFLQNKKQIGKHFSKIKYKFTPLNFPPAFVYICKK